MNEQFKPQDSHEPSVPPSEAQTVVAPEHLSAYRKELQKFMEDLTKQKEHSVILLDALLRAIVLSGLNIASPHYIEQFAIYRLALERTLGAVRILYLTPENVVLLSTAQREFNQYIIQTAEWLQELDKPQRDIGQLAIKTQSQDLHASAAKLQGEYLYMQKANNKMQFPAPHQASDSKTA